MKCRLVLATAFLVYALVMPGNAPASDNLGQSGSKGTDAEHDEKNNHPETAANHQSQPSVTINAVPQIDVKRDWMDRATLIVGILLLLVGGGTGGVILYQSLQTKLATEAMQKSTKLQEVAMRQWVGTGNWRGKMDIARRALNVSFEVSNPTKIPLTFESASIIASGGQRFDIKAR